MAYTPIDGNQRRADKQIRYAIIEIVVGYENSVNDGAMDEKDFPSFEELADEIYSGIMNYTYGDGTLAYRPMDEVKFCGKEWLVGRINERLEKYAESEAEYEIKRTA